MVHALDHALDHSLDHSLDGVEVVLSTYASYIHHVEVSHASYVRSRGWVGVSTRAAWIRTSGIGVFSVH